MNPVHDDRPGRTPRRRRPFAGGWRSLVTATLLLLSAPGAYGQDVVTAEDLTDAHVRRAIDAMADALYERRHPQHFWDPAAWNDREDGSPTQAGGYTALATLALLYAGESYQDPRLREAVESLASRTLEGTYAVAVRANVWAKLPPRFRPNLEADARWLLEGFSESVGGWAYGQRATTTRRDNSIRQYGALGLWEAAKRGVVVEPRIWAKIEEALFRGQLDDGGWNYKADDAPATGSMTTAGLATLFITQDLLHSGRAVRLGAAGRTRNEEAIARGLAWMDASFSPTENPPGLGDYNYFYYLYGVERVGLAGGVKRFGGHDWYREGAAEVIARLCRFDAAADTLAVAGGRDAPGVHELAFGLMFLSRGRVPVAVNKLRVPGVRWNNRPRDAANLARWITQRTETDLSWQVVGFEADPEDWLDASILYLASDEAIPWLADVDVDARRLRREVRAYLRARASGDAADTPPPPRPATPALRRLRRYLDLGGLLLAVNEGSGRVFAGSIERLGTLLYPQHDWEKAPADHWAYTIHDPVKRPRPPLKVLSNGVRDLIVLSPTGDLGASLQGRPKAPETHFQALGNLFLYASELNRPRPRLAAHAWPPEGFAQPRRTVTVARAIHGGNWKPEPLALEAFGTYLAAAHDTGLRIVDRPLAALADVEPAPVLALVSGVEAYEFSEAERQSILRYVRAGGTVLFETVGGRGGFAVSAEEMATTLFDAPVRPLVRELVLTGDGLEDGEDLTRVEYRPFSVTIFGSRETAPRLRGLTVDGATRVLFSREDLSHALLDQPRWGVSGYAPDSARRLLANVVRAAGRSSAREY